MEVVVENCTKNKFPKMSKNTGWFKANLDTLTYDYDKNTVCTEKNHDRFILSLSGHFI